MNGMIFFAAGIFSSAQIATIVVISVVLALLIALNIVVWYLFRKRYVRRLCSKRLEDKRDELNKRLDALKAGTLEISSTKTPAAAIEAEGDEEDDTEAQTDEDEADDNSDADNDTETDSADRTDLSSREILTVASLKDEAREKLGFAGSEYYRKRYYVRYSYSFEGKLRTADDEVKKRYKEFMDDIGLYNGVKVATSFKQQRIYKGRKTLAIVLFRGNTLCVAFALDPAEYADTKYRGIDKSDKKRFEKTPMLFKLTSARRLEYAKYLVVQLADRFTLLLNIKPTRVEYDLKELKRDDLYLKDMLRIAILGEAPDADDEELDSLRRAALEEAAATNVDSVDDEDDRDDEEFDPDDESDDEMNVTVGGESAPSGETQVRFNRSFTARLILADEEVKVRYSDLKNELLSYKGMRSRISWKKEAFRIGRKGVAVFAVRGKSLYMYLNAEPKNFDGTKYRVEDFSQKSPKTKTRLLYRITSDRRAKYAKDIIAQVMADYKVQKIDRQPMNYIMPTQTMETLVDSGLVRVSKVTI
ncbi:MAG: hypothetical protein HDT28_03430 [Clostridiales bacterium]|nr:hypothetical protein [Clostridiales bacterium]